MCNIYWGLLKKMENVIENIYVCLSLKSLLSVVFSFANKTHLYLHKGGVH